MGGDRPPSDSHLTQLPLPSSCTSDLGQIALSAE